MLEVKIEFPVPLPDDPNKWNGWSKYKSPNMYERLCLNPQQQPSNEVIEEHCRELLRWWQKKLPLKNQPSNPLAQMLRPGLDESSRYLTQARVELLNPERRRQMDDELAAQAHEQAVAEFQKILDHRGLMMGDPAGARAILDKARSLAQAGDQPGARAAYQDFLSLWKDADRDVPVLAQAQAEYARLK